MKIPKTKKYRILIALLPLLIFLAVPPNILQDTTFSRAVLDRNGELMRLTLAKDDKYRLFVPLKDISPNLVKAVLLYEDRYFYEHIGVNPVAILRAAWRHIAGSGRGGASTLTMQLARLKYGINSRTINGKLWQMLEAFRIELHYSKDEILEAYLNLAPYGTNIEGVGGASHIYFEQNPNNLSLPEALTLAVIPQSPAKRTPTKSEASLAKARSQLFAKWILENPQDSRYQTLLTRPMHYSGKHNLPFIAPQLCARLLHQEKSGTITTSIEIKLQKQISGLLSRYAKQRIELGIHNAAAILVDNHSKEVIASIGSADYFDLANLGMLDGTLANRSPGSALKPFIYALAFDQGIIHPMSLLKDTPISFSTYAPDNFDHQYEGPLSAHDALIKSRNIPALWVAEQLKHPSFYQFLTNAGLKLKPEASYGLSLVLGGAELTMEELAKLYVMLANDGKLTNLSYIKNSASANATSLISPEAAFMTLDILKDNTPPSGQLTSDALTIPVYWKTGTSAGLRDAWSVGVFGKYTLVVWVGDFRGSRQGQYVGLTTAAPLFFEIMRSVTAKENLKDEIEQKSSQFHLARVQACSDTGDIDTSLCQAKQATWIIAGVSPIKPSGIYRQVLVNNKTGKLACKFIPDETSYRVMQFWSSEFSEVYAKAGIVKSPTPEWEEDCKNTSNISKSVPPRIISPAKNVSYKIRENSDNLLPLKASTDGGAKTAFWFVGNEPVGKTSGDEQIFWQLKHGRFIIRVVDDNGNSDSRVLTVD